MKRSLPGRSRLTPNLVLRPFRRRDVDEILEAASSSLPELNRWLPWAHARYGRGDAVAFVRDSMSAWAEGRAFDFAIRHRDDPERHLGNISVWFTSRAQLVGEIGYWVRSDETGKGVGTEATAAALRVAFDELGMHRVVLRIAIGNTSSERIAEKLGFTREGVLREDVRVNGVWLDHSIWGLLDREYRAEKARYASVGWV